MDLFITIFMVCILLLFSFSIKRVFGLMKSIIGFVISFLFVLLFSMGSSFAAEEVVLESPTEYLLRTGLAITNYAYNNMDDIIPTSSDTVVSIDGPELFPLEEKNEEEIIQEEVVDTSNWVLYRNDCRLTYYGMGEDENGKGYAGLGTRGPLTPGKTIASNTLPYGTTVYIEGLGFRTVEDSGSHHLNDGHIDVCSPTWNRHETRSYASTMPQYADVYIVA